MVLDFAGYFTEHRSRHLEELKSFLRIPSISALPEHKADISRAAEWVAGQLQAAGMPQVEMLPAAGRPLVVGQWHVDDALPTVIIYGHYDVQPADPFELWQTPPFEPDVRDGRIYARGASDDKGNLFIAIKAVEAWSALAGAPPVNVKFMIEGEEEVGSPSLPELMQTHRGLLAADLAISADGSMWDNDYPSLTLGSRGIAAVEIEVRGALSDLHSGSYGGAVQNPLHALAGLLASMRSADGRILVDGFYDQVREAGGPLKEAIAQVPFDERAFMEKLEVDQLFGEPGYSAIERMWLRPTLEVNGFGGGFQGEGLKTVLPREARAKITCRLVPDQDPEQIAAAIEAHVRKHCPPGVRARVHRYPGGAQPYTIPIDHPGLDVAGTVLAETYGRPALMTMIGGTLPVADLFVSHLGIYLVFFSFGGPDNHIHAPNESLPLAAFDRGVRAYAGYLQALAQAGPMPAVAAGGAGER
ncbi:MAG: dipeptidase [Thermaerobacterales bacterium]